MRIISFTGPKGSGKDTCADILKAEGISQGKISFAGPMKKICCDVFDLEPIIFEDRTLKETSILRDIQINFTNLVRIVSLMEDYVPFTIFKDSADVIKFALKNMNMNAEIETPRELLQYVGTEIIRKQINPAWHIEAAFSKKGLEGLDPEGTYCVTDARFPNEYQWLNNRFMLDFTGFYVERPEAEAALTTATHESELAVKEVKDLIRVEDVIHNNGSVEDLRTTLLGKL